MLELYAGGSFSSKHDQAVKVWAKLRVERVCRKEFRVVMVNGWLSSEKEPANPDVRRVGGSTSRSRSDGLV
jgi:hypothetical protein